MFWICVVVKAGCGVGGEGEQPPGGQIFPWGAAMQVSGKERRRGRDGNCILEDSRVMIDVGVACSWGLWVMIW